MRSLEQDYDLVLRAPNAVEASMAKELLESSGIPCFLHGRDRDMAELGAGVHNALTRPDLFVPKGMGERAKKVLDATWSEPIAEDSTIDVGTPDDPLIEKRRIPLSWFSMAMLLAFAALAILLVRMWMSERAGS